MKVHVESAHTGEILWLQYDTSFDRFRSEIGLLTSIPPNDQIIVCESPPFKTLKQMYKDDSSLEGKCFFLYDKRTCLPGAAVPSCPIMKVEDFQLDSNQSSIVIDESASLQEQFRSILLRDVKFENYLKSVENAIRKSVDRQKVQWNAMQCAIAGVEDKLQRLFAATQSSKEKISKMLTQFRQLLDGFDNSLLLLCKIDIHPQLAGMFAARDGNHNYQTLLDTVNTEKLQDYRVVSQENCIQIDKLAARLETKLNQTKEQLDILRAMSNRYLRIEDDVVAFQTTVQNQEIRVQLVRDTYTTLKDSSQTLTADQKNFFTAQRDSLLFSEELTTTLQLAQQTLQNIQKQHYMMCSTVCDVLQLVTKLQTDLPRLTSDAEAVRTIANSPNENIRVLESLMRLPLSYIVFLNEVVRRLQWQEAFRIHLQYVNGTVDEWRSKEIQQRQIFMNNYGCALTPAFFQSLPTLNETPHFSEWICSPMENLPIFDKQDLCAHAHDVYVRIASFDGSLSAMLTCCPNINDDNNNGDNNSGEKETSISWESFKREHLRALFEELTNKSNDNSTTESDTMNNNSNNDEQTQNSLQPKEAIDNNNVNTKSQEFPVGSLTIPNRIQELEQENESLRKALALLETQLQVTNVNANDQQQQHQQQQQQQQQSMISNTMAASNSQEQSLTSASTMIPISDLLQWIATVKQSLVPNKSAHDEFDLDCSLCRNTTPIVLSNTSQSSFSANAAVNNNAQQQKESAHDTLGECVTELTIQLLEKSHASSSTYPTLSFVHFDIDSLVLFTPLKPDNPNSKWVAFTSGLPMHFLSEESWALYKKRAEKKRLEGWYHLIGQVTAIDIIIADVLIANEYNVDVGDELRIIHVIPVKLRKIKKSNNNDNNSSQHHNKHKQRQRGALVTATSSSEVSELTAI